MTKQGDNKMKILTANKIKLTSMALLLSPLFFSNVASAAAKNGVRCPSGTTATFSGGTLRCFTRERFTRDSVCPPLRHPQNVIMRSTGSDVCLAIGAGRTVPSAMSPLPRGRLAGPSDSSYRRIVSQGSPDIFRANKTVYKHPQGAIYSHNPIRGVSCPQNYTAEYTASSKRLKCTRTERRIAACDLPLFIVHRRGKDRCQAKNFLGLTTGPFTVPRGISGLLGDPSRNGWRLRVDFNRNNDYWENTRNAQYTYPRGN